MGRATAGIYLIPRHSLSQTSRHLRRQMNNMAEFFYLHKVIHFHGFWLANPVNIIPGQINKHYMLCTVLF